MKNEYYQKVGDYYNEDAADFDNRYWENPVLQQIRQSFREEVKRYPARTMLEIGCGTGIDLLHFSMIHPDRKIFGIDISTEMVKISNEKLEKNTCKNTLVKAGSVEDIKRLYPNQKFDLIYVFFGALNTVDNLNEAADELKKMLGPKGVMVLTFVNKYYLAGIAIELLRFRFSRAFTRIKTIWGGYSPLKHLPSKCYSVRQIKRTFKDFILLSEKGYSIFHPAWYYTQINRKLGKIRKVLWKIDVAANQTVLKRFGEYTLFTFQLRDSV